jgi:hypothetical protein
MLHQVTNGTPGGDLHFGSAGKDHTHLDILAHLAVIATTARRAKVARPFLDPKTSQDLDRLMRRLNALLDEREESDQR